MRTFHPVSIVIVAWFMAAVLAPADPVDNVKWQKGPTTAHMRDRAEIKVPAGYMFADASDTRLLLEATQNPVSGNEAGFIAPENLSWFAVFEMDDSGYVKDDDKDKLDAGAMLKSIQTGTEESNKERRNKGWAEMKIIGWQQQPTYNQTTHNLEWAIKGESSGHPVINHNTRMLGRDGIMKVTLVVGPETMDATMPLYKDLMTGFTFSPGHKYAEYRQGDKLAQYGLTALIVGGGAAIAAKAGLFKVLWKGIVFVVVGIGAFLKKLFGRKKEA